MTTTSRKPGQGRTRATMLALVAVAGAAWWARGVAGHGAAAAKPSAADATTEGTASAADLGDELASLRRRVAMMEQSDRARGAQAGKALGVDVDEVARVAARKQLEEKVKKYYTPEREAQLFGSYFGALDEARRAEGVDLSWAKQVEALARAQKGTAALASLSVASVECGRTLCRIELDSSNPGLKSAGLGELLQKVGAELPQASVFVPPNGEHMTAYLARAGVDLPPLPSAEEVVADLP